MGHLPSRLSRLLDCRLADEAHCLDVNRCEQVHALAALLDLVRGERPGEFAAPTYARALETLLRARRAAPDALAALVNKYLSYADVRCVALFGFPCSQGYRPWLDCLVRETFVRVRM